MAWEKAERGDQRVVNADGQIIASLTKLFDDEWVLSGIEFPTSSYISEEAAKAVYSKYFEEA